MRKEFVTLSTVVATALTFQTQSALAHDGAHPTNSEALYPIQQIVDYKGQGPKPKETIVVGDGPAISGQGYWTFVAATNVLPIPTEAEKFVKGAHGTLIVDDSHGKNDQILYWGLKGVGWVGFSNHLTSSFVVHGDPTFQTGNIHGADIIRAGKKRLVVAADNEQGRVLVTDTSFTNTAILQRPDGVQYQPPGGAAKKFAPTDVAFIDSNRFYVTDGYAEHYFMPAMVSPLKYSGPIYGGAKTDFADTPHGITYDPARRLVLVSVRRDNSIVSWSDRKQEEVRTQKLPGHYSERVQDGICDLDIWDNYAVAACLNGEEGSAGPLIVMDLRKTGTVASVIKPKDRLGFSLAQHLHDACWFVERGEVYVIFTNWNPGGIGAVKLVHTIDNGKEAPARRVAKAATTR